MTQKTIFTLGYEKLSMVDFIRIVKDKEIMQVVDIRAKNAVTEGRGRFTPEQLSDILTNVSVKYVYLPEAGIPQTILKLPGGNGHFTDFCREYKSIKSADKKLAKRIRELFSEGQVLILGYEEDVNTSHRLPFSEIVISVLGTGFQVQHLSSKDLKPIVIPPPEPPVVSKD